MTEAKPVEPGVERQSHKSKRKTSGRSWRKNVCTTAPKCSMINRHIQLAWEHMCCQRRAGTKGVRGSSRFSMRAASDQLDCVQGEWLGTATLGQGRSAGLNDVRFCVHRSRTQDGNSLWHLNYFEHLTLMPQTDGFGQACLHFLFFFIPLSGPNRMHGGAPQAKSKHILHYIILWGCERFQGIKFQIQLKSHNSSDFIQSLLLL